MKCEQIESRLLDYLDDKLAARDREAVALHVQSCSQCEERVTGFTEVFHLMDSWKAVEPSPSFSARLDYRLKSEAPSYGWWGSLVARLRPMAGPMSQPMPLSNPVFAVALCVMISLAAMLVRYSPAPSENLAGGESTPIVASVWAGADDLTVLEDLEVLGNFDMLQELSNTNPSRQ